MSRQMPRPVLSQEQKPGFIWYPSLTSPFLTNVRELKFCQKCGRPFMRSVTLQRVHQHGADCYDLRTIHLAEPRITCKLKPGTPDEDGVLRNVAPTICRVCLSAPDPEPPKPSEIQE